MAEAGTQVDLTPFFEEGKANRGSREGNVRRFRMDLPDDKREPDYG